MTRQTELVDILQSQVDALTHQMDELNKQLHVAKDQIIQSASENEELSNAKVGLQQQLESLQSQVDTLSRQMEQESHRAAVLEQEYSSKMAELEQQLSSTREKDSETVSSLRQLVTEKQTSLVFLQSQLASVQHTLDQQQVQGTAAYSKLDTDSSQQLDQLKKQLQVAQEQAVKERLELECRLKENASEMRRLQDLCQKQSSEYQANLRIAQTELEEGKQASKKIEEKKNELPGEGQ